MSFAFLPLYTGDYLRDTRHLTPLRHGIYLLLLMHCWDQKGPLPLDEQECAGIANCRSADEVDALRYILSRYFIQMADGWYNKRISDEIAKSETISQHRREGALKKARNQRDVVRAQAVLKQSTSSASPGTPTPTPIKEKPKNQGRLAALCLPDWLPRKEWDAYLESRIANRSRMTDHAKSLAIKKLESLRASGHDPGEVLNQSVLHGWKGLFEVKQKPLEVDMGKGAI